MKKSIRIFLLLLMSFSCLNYSYSDSTRIFGDDPWPFPWGTECPFPWDSISDANWMFELDTDQVNVSFHVAQEKPGLMNVITVVYDNKLNLLAYGNAYYPSSSNIVSLKLQDNRTKDDFYILLRLYSKENASFSGGYENTEKDREDRGRMCSDTSSHVMALTVSSTCNAPECMNKPVKHQILDKVNP